MLPGTAAVSAGAGQEKRATETGPVALAHVEQCAPCVSARLSRIWIARSLCQGNYIPADKKVFNVFSKMKKCSCRVVKFENSFTAWVRRRHDIRY
jgi:hypothetical protein